MAESLGSLIDKLSIKNLRYWHLDEVVQAKEASASLAKFFCPNTAWVTKNTPKKERIITFLIIIALLY